MMHARCGALHAVDEMEEEDEEGEEKASRSRRQVGARAARRDYSLRCTAACRAVLCCAVQTWQLAWRHYLLACVFFATSRAPGEVAL